MRTMIVDNLEIEIEDEKNVLEVVRKAGIELPTFCYHSELSLYGACRMCIVEEESGWIFASCSQKPRAGMNIKTNTKRVRKYRELILELLLSNHDRDCTTCDITGRCDLQELSRKLGINDIRFTPNEKNLPIDYSSHGIIRDPNKCIYCGDCVRICDEVQGIGALSFVNRGSNMQIAPAFNRGIGEVDCVSCGQCRTVCPTGAIRVKDNRKEFWDAISDENKKVIVQIAPAVRVALGEKFGLEAGEITIGKIITALKLMGVDEVYDTAFAADLTVIEEGREFLERLENNENLPLFTSCCPAWVEFAEIKHPDIVKNISTCKSPQQMFGAVVKEKYKDNEKETVIVSIMPCTAKKAEAARDEFENDGIKDVDIVISTLELATMIKASGIVFEELEERSFDMPFGLASGSGMIFGSTGGVSEAVVTSLIDRELGYREKDLIFKDVRGFENLKEAEFKLKDRTIKIAVVHGLKSADELVRQIKNKEKHYDFIEVMACVGGCISGGGQPKNSDPEARLKRAKGLRRIDKTSFIKSAENNPLVTDLYDDILKENRHIIHVNKKSVLDN
ncbi:MAG TPA: [FeFe] hydrogenase, group A [Tissierellaceae bacterium]